MSDYTITPLSVLMGITPPPPIPTVEDLLDNPNGKYSFVNDLYEIGGDIYIEKFGYLFEGCFFVRPIDNIKDIVKQIIVLVSSDKSRMEILNGFGKIQIDPSFKYMHVARGLLIFCKIAFMAKDECVLSEIVRNGSRDSYRRALENIQNHFILSNCKAYRDNVEIIRRYFDES